MAARHAFSRADLMSVLAVLISFAALLVSLFETRILREQHAIMRSEQKAGVWPFVEQSIQYSYDPDHVTLKLSYINKGVGPARILGGNIHVAGHQLDDYDSIRVVFDRLLPDSANMSHSYSSIGGVLSPGEKDIVLSVTLDRFPNDMKWVQDLNLGLTICFCSIYRDCWTVDNHGAPVSTPDCTIFSADGKQ